MVRVLIQNHLRLKKKTKPKNPAVKCNKLLRFGIFFAGLRHFGKAGALAEEVQAYLEDTYCGRMSVETSQLGSLEEREWFADRFEELKKKSFSTEERRQLAKVMLESQVDLRSRNIHPATCPGCF